MTATTILKFIGALILLGIVFGFAAVKYMLSQGMHVPTNSEIINGSKMYIEAQKQSPAKKKESVKPKNIRKLN